jgi:outer membrane scaffolding protein for murein synthesis (MipA/OmpV family)
MIFSLSAPRPFHRLFHRPFHRPCAQARAIATLSAGLLALVLGSSPAALMAQPQEQAAPADRGAVETAQAPSNASGPELQTEFENSAFAGDFLSAGIGVGIGPSYVGSDDYQVVPIPVFQGRVGGIAINPRPAGFALDVIDDGRKPVSLQFGPAVRLNFNRAVDTRDELVEAFPRLDPAVEGGPNVGINFNGVLHSVDSLTLGADVLWDIAGAHNGLAVRGNATYFTPVSRGAAVTLSGHATWIDDSFADYYYTVDPALAPGTPLPAFEAQGGFQSAGVTSLVFVDLDGDLLNGGLALFGVVNYSRVLGDAATSPFTSVAGSADQFFGGVGIGYTF